MVKLFLFSITLLLFIGCTQNSSITEETFDPSYKNYSSVLQNHVYGEKVDYAKLMANRGNLDSFINQLAGISKSQLEKMSPNEQLAFWINAYNGITLRSIIDSYPVKSIQNIDGVWQKTKWYVADQEITLDDIEHKILRPTYKDARIHFGVNCASIGCPPLYNQPFKGETVDSLLDIVASQFVQNAERHQIDYDNNTIVTTEIFSWFWEDFVRNHNEMKFQQTTDVENAVLNFTHSYIDESHKENFSIDKNWRISYAPYDWSLNDIER